MKRILLTNDDGIHAAGLRALYEALRSDFQISIAAPESEMSAVGHAITLNSPLRVFPVKKGGRFYGYAIKGTPADCVKIAVKELMKEDPPDLILSGINLGRNVGVDILYSGTVSAAAEGAFLGYRSAAVSLDTRQNPDYRVAAAFAKKIAFFMLENGVQDGTALNVNIPAGPPEAIKGVCVAPQGVARFEERFERRTDPRGNVYYWLAAETTIENGAAESDSTQLKGKKITITPIHYDLTCRRELERLKACPLPSLEDPKN